MDAALAGAGGATAFDDLVYSADDLDVVCFESVHHGGAWRSAAGASGGGRGTQGQAIEGVGSVLSGATPHR